MSILKSKQVTYEFSLDEMSKLIASDLKIKPEAVKVEYVIQETGDDRFSSRNTEVTKIRVTVDELK